MWVSLATWLISIPNWLSMFPPLEKVGYSRPKLLDFSIYLFGSVMSSFVRQSSAFQRKTTTQDISWRFFKLGLQFLFNCRSPLNSQCFGCTYLIFSSFLPVNDCACVAHFTIDTPLLMFIVPRNYKMCMWTNLECLMFYTRGFEQELYIYRCFVLQMTSH